MSLCSLVFTNPSFFDSTLNLILVDATVISLYMFLSLSHLCMFSYVWDTNISSHVWDTNSLELDICYLASSTCTLIKDVSCDANSFQLSREEVNVYDVVCILYSCGLDHEGSSQEKNATLKKPACLSFTFFVI